MEAMSSASAGPASSTGGRSRGAEAPPHPERSPLPQPVGELPARATGHASECLKQGHVQTRRGSG
eukprot:9886901-Alexandrium_andersonii.AAC.1